MILYLIKFEKLAVSFAILLGQKNSETAQNADSCPALTKLPQSPAMQSYPAKSQQNSDPL